MSKKLSESTSPVVSHYEALHTNCGEILNATLGGGNEKIVARSHQFLAELELWSAALVDQREVALVKMVAHEYQYSLLALTQGHYRHAFKGLRLVLELQMQTISLSLNEIELREWLENRKDTVWGSLIDEANGVLSIRIARAFFPSIQAHMNHHRALAAQLYRECSECVHGNMPRLIPLPKDLSFSQEAFEIWHAKAEIVVMLFHFIFAIRYLREFPSPSLMNLEPTLIERLGHIEEFRVFLGGVESN